ncbi:MAG: sugar phosphate isomerase/epimerase family protein [Anaerolineae bacterium]|nr:sugar phosphate isomerase/epimerase [Anaerolineae bacterium]MDW8299811.1 sugar phosphate isomerase/epimerase family protein [Anaerolineae bacterium]
MPTFGAHAFVWIGEWTTESGNYAIEQASRHGFDFIEIPLLSPQTFDAASHREALKRVGLGATCSLVLPKGAHMPRYPEQARQFLYSALEKVEAVGSQYLGGCIAYELGYLTGQPPTAEERRIVVEVLRDVAAEAQRRGIHLALEACNRYETYLFNTLADTRETILAVGAPNLSLHADTYHMNIEEEGFFTPLVACADVLDYIHMSESHRGLVGSGTVNWEQVWDALATIQFKGKLVLESFAAINPALQAATCLWRPPNQPPAVLAERGLQFLREGAIRAGLV